MASKMGSRPQISPTCPRAALATMDGIGANLGLLSANWRSYLELSSSCVRDVCGKFSCMKHVGRSAEGGSRQLLWHQYEADTCE